MQRIPPRRINITLYGSNEETYEKLCHFRGGFARTIRGIRLLKVRGLPVKINGSAVRANAEELEEIYQIGAELEIPVTVDTYMIPKLRSLKLSAKEQERLAKEPQARLTPDQAARAHWLVMQHDMEAEALENFRKHMLDRIEADEQPDYPDGVVCLASNCSFAIDWRGQMRPCVTLEQPAVPAFELGFEKAWKIISEETKKFRLNPKCTTCRLRPLCPTCAGSARLETGSFDGVPDYLCRYAEELYKILKQ